MDDFEFTEVSGKAFSNIVYGSMSPAEAAEYLRHKPTITRGVGETIRLMYNGTDLQDDVKRFFTEVDPGANPRSVAKSIQNWLNDKNVPSRQNLFKIAFALGLTEDQLDYLLSIADGYGIQYRDAQEMSLAWFLREGLPYDDAVAFCESLPNYEGREVPTAEHTHLTQHIANESRSAHTVDGLRFVCDHNAEGFGTHHLRAHYHFDRYLDQLVRPSTWASDASGKDEGAHDGLPTEREYSLESVVRDYLTLNMPSSRRRSKLAPVQKILKANWPNLTAVKDIRNHEKDVPRKLLLLLYVVTENVGLDDDNEFVWEESFEDRVRDHMVIINAIMDDCGMARLDMRNAFDWLVLYSVAVEDDEGMSDRMEAVIGDMFD